MSTALGMDDLAIRKGLGYAAISSTSPPAARLMRGPEGRPKPAQTVLGRIADGWPATVWGGIAAGAKAPTRRCLPWC